MGLLLMHTYAKFVFLSILSPRDPSIFGKKWLNKLPEPISMSSLSKDQLKMYQEQLKREKEAREKASKKLDNTVGQEETTSEAKTVNQGEKPADSKTKTGAPEAEPSE